MNNLFSKLSYDPYFITVLVYGRPKTTVGLSKTLHGTFADNCLWYFELDM